MLIIIYALVWILFAAGAGILYGGGHFNKTAATFFGFLFSALFFAGIFGVLPWSIDKWYSRYARQN